MLPLLEFPIDATVVLVDVYRFRGLSTVFARVDCNVLEQGVYRLDCVVERPDARATLGDGAHEDGALVAEYSTQKIVPYDAVIL